MESNENNNTDSDANNEEDKQAPSTSSLPKRSRIDPCVASTSSACNGGENCDTDSGSTETKPQNDTTTTTSPKNSGRFAKRSYRKRSESDSSSSSLGLGLVPVESNEVQMRDDDNNERPNDSGSESSSDEERPRLMSASSDDSMSSPSIDGILGNYHSDDSDSSKSESTDNEEKANKVLEKPIPKCDLNIVRNLIYRQSAILWNGHRKTNDMPSNGLIRRINNSIYSVERMSMLHKLEKHYGCVNCLNFNKAGNLLVTGSDDLKVIVWNWAQNKPVIIQTSGHRSNIFQSKFVENGVANNQTEFNLITSARDGDVRQIRVKPDGSSINRLIARHAHNAVHKIAIPDSNPNEILTAGEDGNVVRSDLRERSTEKLVSLRTDGDKTPLYSIAMHPFDPEFCICGQDKFVRVYDKRNAKTCSKMFCPSNILQRKKYETYLSITCAVYNYLGTEILASYGDENIYLFDTQNTTPGDYLHSYSGHKNRKTIKGVNFFGSNSEFVMSGSDCGNIFIWDKNSEAIVQWLHGDRRGVVNCLEGHPHFPIIATSGLDHDVKIWVPMNPDGQPSKAELKKCIKSNLNPSEDFVRSYMRNLARLVSDRMHPRDDSSSADDSSDSDNDDDDDAQTIYQPCEVQ